jgi:thiamine pyrophosphate-dependent acetolactate synthase large subunit-like protein
VASTGDHPRNFYLWGAMGGAATVALGIALAQPDTPVLVVTGDGEMLMGIGAFCTIAMQRPANLSIVVLDNGLYGETGGQKSHTAVSDIAAIAKASGIVAAQTVRKARELDEVVAALTTGTDGPRVFVIKIAADQPSRIVPVREGAHAKVRFRQSFGLAAD